MLKKPLEYFAGYEQDYPGFIDMVRSYENAILPPCDQCGSADTAKVSAGIVSRSIHLAAATTKFKLNPTFPGRFYCNTCEAYFTPEDYDEPIWLEQLVNLD